MILYVSILASPSVILKIPFIVSPLNIKNAEKQGTLV